MGRRPIAHAGPRNATRTAPRLIALVACLLAIGCGPQESTNSPDAAIDATDSSFQQDVAARMQSAQAGIGWLLRHADELPPGWAHLFLLRIHRVAPDAATAHAIEAVLRDDEAPTRRLNLPPRLDHPSLLAPFRLTPILFELMRRKRSASPTSRNATPASPPRGESRAFLGPVQPTQELVYLHQFADWVGRRPSTSMSSIRVSCRV